MQHRLYEALISNTPDLIYAFDLDYRFTYANPALLEMWNRTLENSVGRTLREVGYEDWHAEMHEREIDTVAATGQAIRGEVGFHHAALGPRIYDYIFSPVMNEAGEVQWISGHTRDITELKKTQEHLELVLHELNHRVKNTLATIQSLAMQTFRNATDRDAALADFEARLLGLSNAHNALTRTHWESADLRTIATQALAPFHVEGRHAERVRIAGDSIKLRPQAVLAIAMCLHELASNAVKYGALSTSLGHVDLGWEVAGNRLVLTWRETGGPPVAAPTRSGFGSRLIRQGVARELDGTVELEFREDGVVCTVACPLSETRARS